jgi:hypothetical protein
LSSAKAKVIGSQNLGRGADYTREDFADGRQHYDLILDICNNSSNDDQIG